MARSEKFYKDALGFEDHFDHGIVEGPDMERTMELPGARARCKMLRDPNGVVIELLHFLSPSESAPSLPRSDNWLGLSELSFGVLDVDETAAQIESMGGRVDWSSRTIAHGRTSTLMCADPDGVPTTLIWNDVESPRLMHSTIQVSDLEASSMYYRVLGFVPYGGDESDEACAGPVVGSNRDIVHKVWLADTPRNIIELRRTDTPPQFRSGSRRPINRLGLTHLAFWDDNPDDTIDNLQAHGGRFFESAHVKMPEIELQHGADPDGIRTELMRTIG